MAGALTVAAGAVLLSIAPGQAPVSALALAHSAAAGGDGARSDRQGPTAAPPGRDQQKLALPVFVREPVPPLVGTLAQGLAGYWRLDEGPGSEAARDCRRPSATASCTRWTPTPAGCRGRWGAGWTSAGGGCSARNRPLSCAPPTRFSVAAWVKASAFPNGFAAVVARQLDEDSRDYFFLGLKGRRPVVSGRYWGTRAVGQRELPRGQWVHLAFTRAADGSLRLYQDGAPSGSTAGSSGTGHTPCARR